MKKILFILLLSIILINPVNSGIHLRHNTTTDSSVGIRNKTANYPSFFFSCCVKPIAYNSTYPSYALSLLYCLNGARTRVMKFGIEPTNNYLYATGLPDSDPLTTYDLVSSLPVTFGEENYISAYLYVSDSNTMKVDFFVNGQSETVTDSGFTNLESVLIDTSSIVFGYLNYKDTNPGYAYRQVAGDIVWSWIYYGNKPDGVNSSDFHKTLMSSSGGYGEMFSLNDDENGFLKFQMYENGIFYPSSGLTYTDVYADFVQGHNFTGGGTAKSLIVGPGASSSVLGVSTESVTGIINTHIKRRR